MTARKTSRRKAARAENDDGYSKFRTRWRHVLLLDQKIKAGLAPNCTTLAQELEVSRRTILRDIDFMKSDLGAPLDYDPKKRGYIYTEPNWVMPSLRITEGELFTLMVAEKALAAYAGTPWVSRLQQVFGRMVGSHSCGALSSQGHGYSTTQAALSSTARTPLEQVPPPRLANPQSGHSYFGQIADTSTLA